MARPQCGVLHTDRVYYTKCIARLDRNWEVLDFGNEFINREHLYAIDFDLFGRGSLFQVLCSTRTQAGREVLAGWMTTPANPDEVVARHAASAELRGRIGLRERLAAVAVTRSNALNIVRMLGLDPSA